MPSLIRLSEASVLAMHALAQAAASPDGRITVAEGARACRASRAHLMKVCQRLARAGLLEARRGVGGGFHLARQADSVRLLEVVELFEGPPRGLACLVGTQPGGRSGQPVCIFGPRLAALQRGILAYFRRTRVSELAANFRAGRRPRSGRAS